MKTTLSSLTFLDNKKSIVLYFLIIPLMEMIFLVALNSLFDSNNNLSVATASVIMSGGISTVTCISSSFVYDRNIRIDREVVSTNPYSLYYWGSKVVVSLLISLLLIVINLAIIFLITLGKVDILMAFKIVPLILLYSSVVGLLASILSWSYNNPYFWTNIITTFGNVFSGVVVIYTMYPPILKPLTYIFPFAHTLGLLKDASSYYMYDFYLFLGWLLIFIVIYKFRIYSIRKNPSKSML